jgi:hypothetical protein
MRARASAARVAERLPRAARAPAALLRVRERVAPGMRLDTRDF